MGKGTQFDLPFGIMILSSSFIAGGFLGFFFANVIAGEGELSLAAYFLSYFTAIQEGTVTPHLPTTIWTNLKTPILIFLMGFSFLGTFTIPILFALEGFLFTFSISSLCRFMGISGLIPSFFLFALPAILWVPVIFALGLQSFYAAIFLWGRGKKEEAYPKGYFIRSLLCLCGVIVTIAFEYFLLPLIMVAILQ